jgi:hypothetical protein
MSGRRSARCSPGSEASTSDSSGPAGVDDGRSNGTSGVVTVSPTDGPTSSDTVTSPMSTGQPSSPSTFWPADSLASPSQQPGGKPPKRTRGGSGRSSIEPFAIYDPDSSSWRTSQTSLLSETGQPSETFSGTWPRAGMTRSGIAFQRRPLVPHMNGIASSSWPTPRVIDSEQRGTPTGMPGTLASEVNRMWPTPDAGVFGLTIGLDKHDQRMARLKAKHGNGNGAGTTLAVEVRRWPTPTASDAKASGVAGYPATETHHAGTTLTDAVVRWPTPTAADSDRSSETMMRGNPTLLGAARSWPTPTARDYKDGSFTPNVEVNGLLGRAVWSTPLARDYRSPRSAASERRDSPDLNVEVHIAEGRPPTGALNPDWVEILMGFPTGWTIAGPLLRDPSTTGNHPEPSPAASPTGPDVSRRAATRSSRKSSSLSDDGSWKP